MAYTTIAAESDIDTRFTIVPQSIGDRLARGVAWTTLGNSIAQGGSLLCAVIVARVLGKAAYGQFALIVSTAVAITSVASLGLGITATKYVSQYRASNPERVGRILGLSSGMAVVTALGFALGLAALAPALVPGKVGDQLVVWGLRWSAIYVFFITISGYQMGAMAGFETFRPIAVLNGAYGVASVFLTWQLTTSFGIRGAVISQGCAAMLLWILYHFALRKECRSRGIRVSYRDARDELRVLTRFSIPSAACGIVATTAMWFCNANLAAVNGYAELAVFTALNNMRSIVLFVPALIARVTLPLLNNLLAAQHWGAYRRTFRGTVVLNGGIAVVLAGSLFVAGPQLLALFGKDFRGSRYLFAIFLGSVVLEVIANTLFQALFTAGRIWRNLGIISTWAAVLISCVMLTSRWGAAGIAFAYLSAWSVSLVLYALAAVRQCREGGR